MVKGCLILIPQKFPSPLRQYYLLHSNTCVCWKRYGTICDQRPLLQEIRAVGEIPGSLHVMQQKSVCMFCTAEYRQIIVTPLSKSLWDVPAFSVWTMLTAWSLVCMEILHNCPLCPQSTSTPTFFLSPGLFPHLERSLAEHPKDLNSLLQAVIISWQSFGYR